MAKLLREAAPSSLLPGPCSMLHVPSSLDPVPCFVFHPPCPILHIPSLCAPGSTAGRGAGAAGVSGIPWVPQPVLALLFHLAAAPAQGREDR